MSSARKEQHKIWHGEKLPYVFGLSCKIVILVSVDEELMEGGGSIASLHLGDACWPKTPSLHEKQEKKKPRPCQPLELIVGPKAIKPTFWQGKGSSGNHFSKK